MFSFPLDRLLMVLGHYPQNDQIKGVEDTKLTSRKRGGVVHFVKYFPVYVSRIESLMIGAEGLGIRQNVDAAYDRIVKAMFESLKRMAKMDGEGEDKGQLNYHVILIGASISPIPFFFSHRLILGMQRTCTTSWPRFRVWTLDLCRRSWSGPRAYMMRTLRLTSSWSYGDRSSRFSWVPFINQVLISTTDLVGCG